MSTTALTTDGRFPVRRKRPNRPSVDNAFPSSWCPHYGVRFNPYHLRRLSWTWARVFRDSGLSYSLVATSPQWWDPDGWWHDEKSAPYVIMEYIKLAYYLVKY